MASENVMEFTESNFDDEVINSDKPVLVDFWAEWCGPCRALGPQIDQMAQEFAGKVKVGKLDTEAHRDIAMRFGINALPTVILFKNGQPSETIVGLQPQKIKQVLQEADAA